MLHIARDSDTVSLLHASSQPSHCAILKRGSAGWYLTSGLALPDSTSLSQITGRMKSLLLLKKKKVWNSLVDIMWHSLICCLCRRFCYPKCSQQWSRPGCHTDCCGKRNKHNQCHQRQVETLNLFQVQHILIYDCSLIDLFSFLKTRVHTAQWQVEGHRSHSRDQRRGAEEAWDEGTV